MRLKWVEAMSVVFDFRGFSEPGMLDAAERGVNTVYWVMILFALPPAIWQHFIATYQAESWVYIVPPLLYLPVNMGWFPKQAVVRLYIAALCFALVAVSVNSLNDWRPQPGLYLMIPSVLIIFCIHGSRGMLMLAGLQMFVVGATSAIYGISENVLTAYDLLISLSLWFAVVIACAMLVQQILDSSRYRARELEMLTDRLYDSEARLRDNTLSTQRIVRVSIESIRDELSNKTGNENADAALARVGETIEELARAVIPPSVTAERKAREDSESER